jgi:hypothetical protein
VTSAYRRAWEGYWHLDTSNWAIWIDEATLSDDAYTSWWDSDKVVNRANAVRPGLLGESTTYRHGLSDCVDHPDLYVAGPTTATPRSTGRVATDALGYTTSCVTPVGTSLVGGATETATLQHELGHAYGYNHFDSWISIMNTSQIDVFSCELGTVGGAGSMLVTPDAYLSQCHDIVYGVGSPTDRDLSITPVIQPDGCNLATSACATISGSGPGSPVVIAAGATAVSRTFRYTTLMNRGGIGAEGVFVGTFLSRDRAIGADDVRIDEYFNVVDWQPGSTIRKARTVTFDPRVAMPVTDATYFVLVKVDHDQYFSETNETNNVTDLGISFVRR